MTKYIIVSKPVKFSGRGGTEGGDMLWDSEGYEIQNENQNLFWFKSKFFSFGVTPELSIGLCFCAVFWRTTKTRSWPIGSHFVDVRVDQFLKTEEY